MTDLRTRIACTAEDVESAQALRYAVFVDELGGGGAAVDHAARREGDAFDPHATHLLLEDLDRPSEQRVVGTYRLMSREQADAAGQFYSADEFDLTELLSTGRTVLELGRSCLHPDYRKGPGLHLLWQALAAFVASHNIEILFGVASFHGTDLAATLQPRSYLHHFHAASAAMRTSTRMAGPQPKVLDRDAVDRKAALAAMPPLIKAYLRLGAVVGDGVFVDHAFNTTDVCLMVDVAALSPAQRVRLERPVRV